MAAVTFAVSACSGAVVVPVTASAVAAPPCTGALQVGTFEVQTDAGLRVSDEGFHLLGIAFAGLEYSADTAPLKRERFKKRIAERFERELRRALASNARDLGVSESAGDALSVRGTLFYREQHDVKFKERSGFGAEGEGTRVTRSLDAHLVVSDALGAVVAETTVSLAGPSERVPQTSPKYGVPLDVWRAVEELVRRRVSIEVPLAFAWSREVRSGLRAAQRGDWETAMAKWTRATSDASATTRRAAHYNLFVAHERAGRIEEARAQLLAAEKERPAAIGYTVSQAGRDPEGHRVASPDDLQAHLWRLKQYETAKRCESGITPVSAQGK